jgi:D-galactarolactone cycloisomerase
VNWGDGVEKDVVLLEITTAQGITGLGSAYTSVNQLRDDYSDERHRYRFRRRCLRQKIALCVRAGLQGVKLCIDNFGHRDNSQSEKEWELCEANLLRFARKIVGKEVKLMLDVYGSDPKWTGDFDWAAKTTRVLEELDYLWFEEPFRPKAFEDYAQLTQLANIAIAGGEDFILVKDFENLSNINAANILQPDCTRVGGLTRMRSIRNAASANNIDLIPHGWNTAVGLAADLHFQATMSDEKYCMVEYMPHRMITDLLRHNPFSLDNEGRITAPTGAGLGIELNDEFKNNHQLFQLNHAQSCKPAYRASR